MDRNTPKRSDKKLNKLHLFFIQNNNSMSMTKTEMLPLNGET